jgi:signal peptidase I
MNETPVNGEQIEEKDKEKSEWINSILIAIVAAVIIRIFLFAPTIVVGQSMEPTLHDEIQPYFLNLDNDRLIAERVSYFLNIRPKRGDIITFTEPSSQFYLEKNPAVKALKFFTKKEYIKRVIGVEGDHVQIKGNSITIDNNDYYNYDIKENKVYADGILVTGDHTAVMENASVYLNGKKQEEKYTNGPWNAYLNIRNGKITPSGNNDVNVDLKVQKGYVFAMGDNRNYSYDSRKFTDFTTKNGCISLKEMSGRILFRFWPFNRFGEIK